MKTPTGQPVMQHQFAVTFNDADVPGLTEWIDDVAIDYVEKKIGLSFMLVHDNDPSNKLSHQKLAALMLGKAVTIEVLTLDGSRNVVCKEVFHKLKLVELYHGFNAFVSSSDDVVIEDETEDADYEDGVDLVRPTDHSPTTLFDNPVRVSASIQFGVKDNE